MGGLKRTPIFPAYQHSGAKLVDFGGWELPVQFSGIKKEHQAVRNNAGIFDVSHMGEIAVSGPNSKDYLQKMLTNDIYKLSPGKAQYTFLCNENGGTIDDLIVYMIEEEQYLLVVNAANTEKDFNWLRQHRADGIKVENKSDSYAQIAIQGPNAEQILQKMTDVDLKEIKFFRFQKDVILTANEIPAIVSRTGYTGEDGFELYVSAEDGQNLWEQLLESGKEDNLVPIGLGARDTLRFEACLPLYGQELSEDITPLEAGMDFAVKVKKETDFMGKQALMSQKENGVKRQLAGLEMIDKGIPRHGYPVFLGDKKIGTVTTGTQSPTLEKNIGLALLNADFAESGKECSVEIRTKRLAAKVIQLPFYKRK